MENASSILNEKENQGETLANIQSKELIDIAYNILKFPKKTIKSVKNLNEADFFNRRIELNGYCGSIKYIGNLKHKKDSDSELWLGIEWDDPNRGKHNGTVENFKYFSTKENKNSASLIKISKVNFGLNINDALKFKYNFETQKDELYTFMSNIVENELYIQTSKKRIDIEFVGKDKAIENYSNYKNLVSIDLSFSYLSNISLIQEDLGSMFPRLRELNLTKSLLYKWSDFSNILLSFKSLEFFNFSENLLIFDEKFYEIKNILNLKACDNANEANVQSIQDISNLSNNHVPNFKINSQNLNLKTLILNKNFLCLDDIMQISFLLKKLENLYLFDNQINENNLPELNPKTRNSVTVEEFKENFANLKGLILEKNNITLPEKVLSYFAANNLTFLNLNQNNIRYMVQSPTDVSEIKSLYQNLKILNLDFNCIQDYEILFYQLKHLSNLEELNILNNGFARHPKLGLESAKINIIGRLLKLSVLNHTTLTKEVKRDSELIYLKNSVKDYFSDLKEKFDKEVFEKFMTENHPNYFILKKKYYDPVEDFLEGISNVTTNTIKGNMIEFSFMNKEKTIKKKFPKTTTFYNLKNLLSKLFKINASFNFRIVSAVLLKKLKLFGNKKPLEEVDKNDHSPDEIFDITDESKKLEDFNISDNDVILLY